MHRGGHAGDLKDKENRNLRHSDQEAGMAHPRAVSYRIHLPQGPD
jgi:hypothetical protein